MSFPRCSRRALTPLAVAGAFSLVLLTPGQVAAQEGFSGQGSGSATVTFEGEGGEALIEVDWQGLAAEIPDLTGTPYEALSGMPFPHAQHIHAGTEGECPTPAADADGNGVIDTPEGLPAYGPVLVSLTEEPGETTPAQTLDVGNFPAGDSATYSRTINLDMDADTDAGTFNPAEQVRADNAVIVVHGLDPAIMPGDTALADSAISDELPLAATAPVLCGVLTESGEGVFTAQLAPVNPVAAPADETAAPADESAAQVDQMPAPGVATGGGSTAATDDSAWPVVPVTALVAALALTGLFLARRQTVS